ncbi:hypothetical protein BDF20DRAFT_529710 [Mycotypha africana]|uniref:uncharacterized protein n=1 Tax=Mycotypha africana TaxID=64632 RepID=UPI00230190E3|nr:uncharacterized protein BDF20DRAFT_529710 [Mycotypha africana]KAI8979755.1 hypothetical protein BDF20DRAFT_529710 [Mycotypha africana]
MHDRMLYLLGSLVGSVVEVTVRDGTKFKGILHGASTEGDLGVALKLAQKVYSSRTTMTTEKNNNASKEDTTTTNDNPVINTLLIFSKDLIDIYATQVDFTAHEDRNTFKTDTDISGKIDIKERELHKWFPGDDSEGMLLEEDAPATVSGIGLSLEAEVGAKGGSWDQFSANEKLFGLKTDFNEELYTTPLNRNAPDFKDREKRATQIANEIQNSTTNNVHMLEERGLAIDDSGLDEEDLYGAVVRESSASPMSAATQNSNKYVPPALRKQQSQPSQQQVQQQKKETLSKATPLDKLMTTDLPKGPSNPSPIANLPTARRESNEKSDKLRNEPPKRIEAEIATTFRYFAMMEKDKLHAKKQALQKKEKDGRLAELKAFHQNFKLTCPIPADLVPLLSKKRSTPAQSPSSVTSSPSLSVSTLSATAATTSPTAAADTNSNKETAQPTPAVTDTTASSATTTQSPSKPTAATAIEEETTTVKTKSSSDEKATKSNESASSNTNKSTFKFNVKASSFKPNPSAAAFVPGAAVTTPSSNQANTNRNAHRKSNTSHEKITLAEAFRPSFLIDDVPPHSVGPTWPFGHKSYRVQFTHQFATGGYEDIGIVYSGGYPSPTVAGPYGYGYPPTAAYRYPPPYVPGMPPHMQQPPYMSPQFVHHQTAIPVSAAAIAAAVAAGASPTPMPMPVPPPPPNGYPSPQMPPTTVGVPSPHGSPFLHQGYPPPSPQQQQQQQRLHHHQPQPHSPYQHPHPHPHHSNGGGNSSPPTMVMRYPAPHHQHNPANTNNSSPAEMQRQQPPYQPHHQHSQQHLQKQQEPYHSNASDADTKGSN